VRIRARSPLVGGLETEAWPSKEHLVCKIGPPMDAFKRGGVTSEDWVAGDCDILEATNEEIEAARPPGFPL